jgi:hypothetical protein
MWYVIGGLCGLGLILMAIGWYQFTAARRRQAEEKLHLNYSNRLGGKLDIYA